MTSDMAHACSWVTTIGEADSRKVILGKISGTVTETYRGRKVFGVEVTPVIEYGSDAEVIDHKYRVFPHGVGADCSSRYFAPNPGIEGHYEAGRLVTLIGYTVDVSIPGNLRLSFGAGLDILPEHCTEGNFLPSVRQWSGDSQGCGSEIFHAYRVLAMLPSASSEEALGILSGLSQSKYWVEYEDIVNKYVSSEVDRAMLIRLRYGPAMEIGCAVKPKVDYENGEDYQARRIARSRWYEYCTRDRIEAARGGT